MANRNRFSLDGERSFLMNPLSSEVYFCKTKSRYVNLHCVIILSGSSQWILANYELSLCAPLLYRKTSRSNKNNTGKKCKKYRTQAKGHCVHAAL